MVGAMSPWGIGIDILGMVLLYGIASCGDCVCCLKSAGSIVRTSAFAVEPGAGSARSASGCIIAGPSSIVYRGFRGLVMRPVTMPFRREPTCVREYLVARGTR